MTAPWLEVLDDTIRACVAHRRQDLVEWLHGRRTQLLDRKVRVLVVGAAGQGKSQLVNALVNAPVCAVGDDHTTTVPAVVQHAETPSATLVADDGLTAGPRALERPVPARTPVAVEAATARANRSPDTLARIEIGLPRELLAGGLALIDTPPVTDPAALSVPTALPQADAALVVSDATGELSPTELDLLGKVVRLCPMVLVVLTKIDLTPDWRRVAERNRTRLANGGLPATVLPVSAALRLAAARAGDRALNEESGFGELVRCLHRDLLGRVDVLAGQSAGVASGLAVDQLLAPLREAYTATRQADTGELTERWREAGRALERLQRASARWQTLLADEVADLQSDVEYDLRDRTRQILREVDEYFEVADPAKVWPEFERWLRDNLTAVAETNSRWLLDRFDWIARKIGRHVAPREPDVLPAAVARDAPPGQLGELRMPSIERFGIGQKLFVGMRGSYSGLLMFGLATTLAGMSLINPISLGAGAAFGAKSVFEERGNRLKRRQAAARTAAHRYVDDFYLGYGKHSKDTARLIHRALRDRFSEIAEERRAEITESAKAIKEIIDADAVQRGARAQELKRGIDELALLRRRAHALRGGGGAAPRELTA
ncbi:Dynamin family protein [Amycolatopsis arida]|uniref:Dynamin family protein n=1 Tax=Amycolatopsis arida TaxID=587909 RepID=A0A1I5SFH5_9PSEU|nr:dynamin family protein [Amycolatopsis arida]TDX96491.1 dynamin family protein [Amycolatopsis arida]SFP69493.1 Dynamin family protein [Amycolatopsis arida]